MPLNKYQIAQSTYNNTNNGSVGRIFREGSFWDKAFKAASKLVVLVPGIGAGLSAAMIAADAITPERPKDGSTGSSPLTGSGSVKVNVRDFFSGVSGVGAMPDNKFIKNPPKVF